MGLKDTYNKIAKDWHQDHQDDDWYAEAAEFFTQLFDTGASILDVGCAGGIKAKTLIEHGLKVTGIDFSEEFITIAKKEVPEGTFLVRDMREIDDLGIFDGIFAQASLLHIPRDEVLQTLQTLQKHLAENGYMYASVKRVWEGNSLEEHKVETDYGYPYERFFSYFTPEEMRAFFIELGLTIVYEDVRQVGSTDWIQIIGKNSKPSGE